MTKTYEHINIKNLPQREVLISGEITKETIDSLRIIALEKIKKDITIDGFRKGQAPDEMVRQKVGDIALLEEAGELALQKAYSEILKEYKIDAIGKPEITITKIGVGSPLGFTIKTALAPEVKIGAYKKIAEKVLAKEDSLIEVTDADVEKTILQIRKDVAHKQIHETEGPDEHTHNHGEIKDEDLPEVNLDFIKTLGDFASIEDFKAKIRENLTSENVFKAKDKKRTEIVEEIIKESVIEIPRIIIEGEMEKMKAQLEDDLSRSGITYTQYLEYIKKTEEEIRKNWEPVATKRAQLQIILNTIAKEENINPEEEDIKREMEIILKEYKDAERFRVRMYVETFLVNELVFKFLEGLKK